MERLEPISEDELSVQITELLVATADSSDPLLDDSVSQLLHAMRLRMAMDVVFVSEFIDGRRMFRFVDSAPGAPAIAAGDSSPAAESVCRLVVEGRVPELVRDLSAMPPEQLPPLAFKIGAHLSTPILLSGQRVYGTLCCFSTAPRPELVQADLEKLRLCAKLVARKVELSASKGLKDPPPDWKLEPRAEYESSTWRAASPRSGSR